MFQRIIILFAILFFAVSISAQIKVPKVEVKVPKVEGVGDAAFKMAKDEFKKVVKDIPFQVNSSELKLNDPKYSVAGIDIDTFMKKTLIPALSKLINVLPADKKVRIDGHASSTGSEQATDNFIGNIALSKARAEAVLDYILANSQIDKNRCKIIANGSSKPLSGIDSANEKNCRVSLDIE